MFDDMIYLVKRERERDHTLSTENVIAVNFIVIAVHALPNTIQYYEWRHVLQSQI